MNRENLWAPWRMEYIRAPKGGVCVFCEALAAGDDPGRLVLHRGERVFAILNRYPYTAGHLMVVPNRHVGALEDLSADEVGELWAVAVQAKRALDAAFRPDGYNLGINLGPAAGAGVKDHLHLHVVPRWGGDTNFMPVLGEVHVISQHLDEIYESLVPGFPGAPATAQPQRGS